MKSEATRLAVLTLSLLPFLGSADPLDGWHVRQQISSPASVAYGNGRFVVMPSQPYITTQVLISTNGTDWTSYIAPEFGQLSTLTYGNGLFFAAYLRYSFTNAAVVYSSMDGVSWTLRAVQSYTPNVVNQARIAAGNGSYVLAGVNLTVSTNLADWKTITPGSGSFNDLKFLHNVFLAPVGFASQFLVSADGVVWEYATAPANRIFQNIGFANGRYAAFSPASADGTQPAISAYSVDAMSWQSTNLPDPFTNSTKLVSAGNAFFLLNAVGADFYSSADSVSWQSRSFGANIQITDIAFGANAFVAVGDFILQSDSVTNVPPPPNLSLRNYPGLTVTGTLGQHYRIEYTDDPGLTNAFQPLTNILLSVDPYLWVDTTATNSERRFYRAVILP